MEPVQPASIVAAPSPGRALTARAVAAATLAAVGVLFFGPAALWLTTIATAAGVLTARLASRWSPWSSQAATAAATTGLLVALMLPASVSWHVAAIGAVLAVSLQTWMRRAFGRSYWHPAVAARVILQLVFTPQLSFQQEAATSPVLAPRHLLIGGVERAVAIRPEHYQGWLQTSLPRQTEALRLVRPVQILREFTDGRLPAIDDAFSSLAAIWLPPWEDTLIGAVPGGVGETSVLSLLAVGLYLIYRGALPWRVPAFTLAAAAVAVAFAPIDAPTVMPVFQAAAATERIWLPALHATEGWLLGALYVLYQLTSGQLVFAAFVLTAEPDLTPKRARGQLWFGVGVGVLTIALRLAGPLEGEAYWAILAMNTIAPAIIRLTSRSRRTAIASAAAPAAPR